MKKFFAAILVLTLIVSCGLISASAEWLYATRGDTNIRACPDLESDTLGVFLNGRKIWVYDHVLTDDGRNWCQVSFFGKTGYISDFYSSYEVDNPEEYMEEEYVELEGYHDVEDEKEFIIEYDRFEKQTEFEFQVISDAMVYSEPDSEAPIFGYIKAGRFVFGSVIYTSEDGKAWLTIKLNDGRKGYIISYYLMLTEGLINDTYPVLGRRMIVTGGSVNVRDSCDINSKDLGTVHRGDVVTAHFFICVQDAFSFF